MEAEMEVAGLEEAERGEVTVAVGKEAVEMAMAKAAVVMVVLMGAEEMEVDAMAAGEKAVVRAVVVMVVVESAAG
ncbi:hypothetical protein AB1Y20_023344 [Prymnesium parvum]|uniref:Uncharacterized protein n=1 Tax=Prymnesium parvum TaxID=97485 RepID=A0AB34JCX7_PRYPA